MYLSMSSVSPSVYVYVRAVSSSQPSLCVEGGGKKISRVLEKAFFDAIKTGIHFIISHIIAY